MSSLLSIITTSEKRKRLLNLLNKEPLQWDEIKTHLDVTASGMLPQIKILESEGLIAKKDRVYSLTDIGRLVVDLLEPLDNALTVIEQQKKFWQEHNINALPRELRIRIGDIKNPQIIESNIEDSFEPHNQFLEMLTHSKRVLGVSPIIHPIYPRIFLSFAKTGREVHLILTKKAFDKIKKEFNGMLLEGLQYENAHLSIVEENIKFAFISTEMYFCMGMFTKNDIFNSKQDLVSKDPSAIRWGEDLFSYYLNRSHFVNKKGKYCI
jgi:predicted transcriptional regulator